MSTGTSTDTSDLRPGLYWDCTTVRTWDGTTVRYIDGAVSDVTLEVLAKHFTRIGGLPILREVTDLDEVIPAGTRIRREHSDGNVTESAIVTDVTRRAWGTATHIYILAEAPPAPDPLEGHDEVRDSSGYTWERDESGSTWSSRSFSYTTRTSAELVEDGVRPVILGDLIGGAE